MKGTLLSLILILAFSATCQQIQAAKRFEQQIIMLQNPTEYQYSKKDDVNFPFLATAHFSANCLVYRGAQYYYVEVGILSHSQEDLIVSFDSIAFHKPGYPVLRTDTVAVAREISAKASRTLTPSSTPHEVKGTTTTTVNAGVSTFANQANISGVATTSADQSTHAGANLGNAIVNAIEENAFYRSRARDSSFADFLYSHAQPQESLVLHPAEERVLVATFRQEVQKRAPFEVLVRIGSETLTFKYKE